VLQYFSKLTAVEKDGGIIVLEINQNDYSLTEIAQIIESNDAKILSLYVKSHYDSMKMNITIKVNVTDITAIIQTFNRYNYIVKASFMESDKQNDIFDSRYRSFMKYLSI